MAKLEPNDDDDGQQPKGRSAIGRNCILALVPRSYGSSRQLSEIMATVRTNNSRSQHHGMVFPGLDAVSR
jgi:hypothetical protein